jgi:hypothetical protein
MGSLTRDTQFVLLDVEIEENVVVDKQPYGDKSIANTVEDIQIGNTVSAELSETDGISWRFESVSCVTDTELYYMATDDFLVGPVADMWNSRDGDDVVVSTIIDNQNSSSGGVELQVQNRMANYRFEDEEGDILTQIQLGEISVESLFSGQHCQHISEEVAVIIFVDVVEHGCLASYLFTEKGPQFSWVLNSLVGSTI